MRLWTIILLLILLAGFASADCVEPYDGMKITESTVFCSKTFDLPNGIIIDADNIELDCNTAILRGTNQEGTGITIEGRKHATIQDCNIVTYKVGVYVKESSHISIVKNSLLKNIIGIRLYNAYENLLSDNADKSTEKPFSVINSKFNIFMLGNKNVEQDFCKENYCNEVVADIKPCEDDDFYCSEQCNPSNDNDCAGEKEILQPKQEIKKENKTTPTAQVVQPQTMTLVKKKESGISWIFYPLFYILTFFMLQFYTFVKKY